MTILNECCSNCHSGLSRKALYLSVDQNAAACSSCSQSRAVGVEDASGGYGRLELAAEGGHLLPATGVHIYLQPMMKASLEILKSCHAPNQDSQILQCSLYPQAMPGAIKRCHSHTAKHMFPASTPFYRLTELA